MANNGDGMLYSSNNSGPVKVSQTLPILPKNRWILENKRKLRNHLTFNTISQRNVFISQLLQYEAEKVHFAEIEISDLDVKVCIFTKNLESITELDKEYAKFVDVLYKDVMYVPEHDFKPAY